MANTKTAKNLVLQLDRRIKEIEKSNTFFPCVQATHDSQINRVFLTGINGDGVKIGDYSTSPIYVNPKYAPVKFPTKGKTGKTKFKSEKPHETAYFDDGYKGFREAVGRQTGFVDLKLWGNLMRDFATSLSRQSGQWASGVKSVEDGNKVRGAAERYGDETWMLTEAEHITFQDCCKRKTLEAMKKK